MGAPAVRHDGSHQHGDRPGRRRGGRARSRHRSRARLQDRLQRALRLLSIRASARRSPSRGGAQRRVHRRRDRWRSRTISTSAIRAGPRSTSSCARRSAAWAKRATRSARRSPAATSRSTTRIRRAPSIRRLSIGMVGVIESLAHVTRSHFQRRGRRDRAARRADAGARRERVPRAHSRRRRRRAARVRPRRRARADRRAARGDQRRSRSRRRTTAATAALPSRSPSAASWIAERSTARRSTSARGAIFRSRALLFGEAQARVVVVDRPCRTPCSRSRSGTACRRASSAPSDALDAPLHDHDGDDSAHRPARDARRRVPRSDPANHVAARRRVAVVILPDGD